MSHTKQEYQRQFEKFIAANPAVWRRYETSAAKELLLAHLCREQQPPSQITTELAIKKYLVRVDGKTIEDDKQQALEQITDRIDQPDLTRDEVESFQSISARELATRYWQDGGSNAFRIRFDKAVRTQPYGLIFTPPGRPAGTQEVASGDEVELTAEQYHALDSRTLQQKLRDPKFKASVYRLLAERKI